MTAQIIKFRMEHLDVAGNVTHVTDESATVIESADDLEALFALHGCATDDDDDSDDPELAESLEFYRSINDDEMNNMW